MEQLEVGFESTEEECWAKTGKAPVTTKWVRVNKGTSSNPFISARLVASRPKKNAGPRQGRLPGGHQVGSCEQGNIVKHLHQCQARGERLQDERRRILVCGHAAS